VAGTDELFAVSCRSLPRRPSRAKWPDGKRRDQFAATCILLLRFATVFERGPAPRRGGKVDDTDCLRFPLVAWIGNKVRRRSLRCGVGEYGTTGVRHFEPHLIQWQQSGCPADTGGKLCVCIAAPRSAIHFAVARSSGRIGGSRTPGAIHTVPVSFLLDSPPRVGENKALGPPNPESARVEKPASLHPPHYASPRSGP
jgi:hypothetical protein